MKIEIKKIVPILVILLIVIGALFFLGISNVEANPVDAITTASAREAMMNTFTILFAIATALTALLILNSLILAQVSRWGIYFGPDAFTYIFIDIGFTWILGLVNMFFVIAFVFAALIYILDIESGIVDKKTIPRLIILAFFTNFSLLFVQLIADFFIIMERGVAEQIMPINLLDLLRIVNIQASLDYLIFIALPFLVKKILNTIADLLIKMPFVGWTQKIKKILTSVAIFGPYIIVSLSHLLLGIVFFLYSVLFIARTIMFPVLAMVAPLVFLSLAFPKTRKYFAGWLKQLILWGIMGTIIMFVLSFGFQMRDAIAVVGVGVTAPIFGETILNAFFPNLFFGIYALISLFMIKRFLPSAAQGVVGMLQKGAMAATAVAGLGAAGLAIKKYAPVVQGTLGKMEKKYEGTILGDIMGDARVGVSKLQEKEVQKVMAKRANKSEKENLGFLKTAKEEENIVNQEAAIRALKKGGAKLHEEELRECGFGKDGKNIYNEVSSIVGPEFINANLKHLELSEKCRKSIDKIKEVNEDLEKLDKGEIISSDRMKNYLKDEETTITKEVLRERIGEKIKETIEKQTTNMMGHFVTASPADIAFLSMGAKDVKNNQYVQDAMLLRDDPVKLNAFCLDEPNMMYEMAVRKAKEAGSAEKFIQDCSKYRYFLERLAAVMPGINIDPSLVRVVMGGEATVKQRKELEEQVKAAMFAPQSTSDYQI